MLSNEAILDAFNEVAFLKDLKRTGWKKRKVPRCETVASHITGLGVLALLTCPPKLNRNKVALMAMIHDLVEAPKHGLGDASVFLGADPVLKKQKEAEMADYLFKKFPGALGKKLRRVWQEYEDGKNPEAKFLRQLDKVEACLQARLYYQEKRLPWKEVISFINYARKDVSDLPLVSLLDATAVRPKRVQRVVSK